MFRDETLPASSLPCCPTGRAGGALSSFFLAFPRILPCPRLCEALVRCLSRYVVILGSAFYASLWSFATSLLSSRALLFQLSSSSRLLLFSPIPHNSPIPPFPPTTLASRCQWIKHLSSGEPVGSHRRCAQENSRRRLVEQHSRPLGKGGQHPQPRRKKAVRE